MVPVSPTQNLFSMYLSGIGVSEHSLLPLKSPGNFIANETILQCRAAWVNWDHT